MVLDVSRHVNPRCLARKFKIQSTREFMNTVKKDDYLWTFDFRSAYHHVQVNEDHQKYLGFSIELDGKKRYFKFQNLPFGYNDACRVITKILRVPLHHWRNKGIKVYIHVDDGMGFKAGKREAQKAADSVREDLRHLGLITSEEKCCWKVSQTAEWTGFKWNTREFKVYLTDKKKKRLEDQAKKLLAKKTMRIKELASLVGLIVSCGPAVGRAARFRTRFASIQVAEAVEKSGWNGELEVEHEVKEELRFWAENLDSVDGQLIRKTASVENVKSSQVFSDAGGKLLGGALYVKGHERKSARFQVSFSTEEQKKSSTWRELRGIEEGIQALGEQLRGTRVDWGCDNWAACKATEFGSTKKDCMEVALRIDSLIRKYDLEFNIVWHRRNTEQIRLADKISKDLDFSDYRISRDDFQWLEEKFGSFSMDYFASDYSYRMRPFCGRYRSEKAQHSDAFSLAWDDGFGFYHPPITMIARVLEKAQSSNTYGLLLAPDWQGNAMIAELDAMEGRQLRWVASRRMVMECPDWFENNTFRGLTDFDMRVYIMDFR